MSIKEDTTAVVCDNCGKEEEIENQDHIPAGWFLLFSFNYDDGNNYPAQEACGVECLTKLAEQAQNELN